MPDTIEALTIPPPPARFSRFLRPTPASPAERVLAMAAELTAACEGRYFARLNEDQRCEMRSLSMALHAVGEELVAVWAGERRVGWWRRVRGWIGRNV